MRRCRSMTQAAFGLLGVIIGGVLTGFVGFVAERQRDRRLARVSARIVREHLLGAMRAGEDYLAGRPSSLRATADALVAAWRDERRALAVVMDYEPYAEVAAGVRAADEAAVLQQAPDVREDDLRERVAAVGAAAHQLKAVAAS
jgi:hypothetical protein